MGRIPVRHPLVDALFPYGNHELRIGPFKAMEKTEYPIPRDLDHLVQVLSSFTNYEKNRDFHKGRIRFDLKNMLQLCKAANDPHLATPCIHITGSKGKGSTAWMLTSIFQSLGLKTGTYTSPHLECMTERIAIRGEPLAMPSFLQCADKALDVMRGDSRLKTSFFEFMTLAAMMAFRSGGVEAAIYEVGLGGRLDATNVVQPAVSIITTVEREHCAVLGDTEEAIAQEKAGIIKPGTPVVTALPEDQTARAVVEERAKQLDAPLYAPGHGLEILDARGGPQLTLEIRGERLGPFKTPMPQSIQGANLACAVAAAYLFSKQQGVTWNASAIDEGLDRLSLPGRFETVAHAPDVILDGAHTPASIQAALEQAAALAAELPVVILGLAEDKEAGPILDMVRTLSREMIFTAYEGGRSIDPAELRRKVGDAGVVTSSVSEALDHARKTAGPAGTVLVLGSFYLVGEARKVIRA